MGNMKRLSEYLKFLKVSHLSKVYFNTLVVFVKEYLIPKRLYIENITRENITEYLSIKNYSANALNIFIKAGKHFFKVFLEKEDNVFNKLKQVKVEGKIPDYISEGELKQGVKHALTITERCNPKKTIALLYFMFYSGLRKGEILNLNRVDFFLEKKPPEVKVKVPTKGKNERIIYLPYKLRVLLYRYFNSEKENKNAFNLCPTSLDYVVGMFSNCFPDKRISAHTFRHSFARDLIKAGIDVTIVSKLLGHKNIRTTLIYVNPDEEMVRDIYKKKKLGGDKT